jgi:hypothetical protein
MNLPILLIIYKRPDTTAKVFEIIKKIKPSKLYIAADGPKSKTEEKACQLTRDIVARIDWRCETKRNYLTKNLGLKKRMESAITWFFANEEKGIILEDDCLPDMSFFKFCEELLEKYKDDERVMSISGNNFLFGEKNVRYSYHFSRFNHCWGWATWRRAWKLYDGEMKYWSEIKRNGWLGSVLDSWISVKYWTMILDLVYKNKINSWAYRWTYSCWLQEGLSIIPAENLVVNIGFGKNATNTKNRSARVISRLAKIKLPLKHPRFLLRDSEADNITEKNHYITPIITLGLIYRYLRFKLHL